MALTEIKDDLLDLSTKTHLIRVRTGDSIIRQGQFVDCVFFLKSGSCKVLRKIQNAKEVSSKKKPLILEVEKLHPGAVFGFVNPERDSFG